MGSLISWGGPSAASGKITRVGFLLCWGGSGGRSLLGQGLHVGFVEQQRAGAAGDLERYREVSAR